MHRGRSAAASALAQSTLLGEVLEGARVGVLAIDAGCYVAANAYACELLGYERDELIGRRTDELQCEWLPDAGVVTLTRQDGTPVDVEYRLVPSEVSGMLTLVGLFWPARSASAP